MPTVRRPTLPYRAGYARGRGEAAVRTREMKFKVAFEETRQQNTMQQLTARFQDAQNRLKQAAEMQQQQEQDKAQAESLGIMAAMRGEELDSKNPYTALAFAEVMKQKGPQIPEEELRGFAEELGYGEKLAERIPKVWEGLPVAARGALVTRSPALAAKGKTVEDRMRMASGKMRDYMLARGTPKTPKEFTERAQEYEKRVWMEKQAKTKTEAREDAERAYGTIYRDVEAEEGYQAKFDSIRRWLESIGWPKDEIAAIAEIKYERGRPGRNYYVDIQWHQLRQMLYKKRLAGVQSAGRPGEPTERKSEKFRTLAEDILK